MFAPSSWSALPYYQSEDGIRMRDVVAGDADLRTDPQRDVRRLSIFAIGLLVTYAVALVLLWREGSARTFWPLMIAPTIGALLAARIGPGIIQWGRPKWWLLAGLAPAVAALIAYTAGSVGGLDTLHLGTLGRALAYAPLAIVVSTTGAGALAEEIGWRGFLWPLLRGRYSFALSSLIVAVVWWLFHVPAILLGWYGSLAGLPAFTVALVGMVLFVGVITDRSKSVWPSIVAHATWNALVLTGFAVAVAGTEHAFSGSAAIVGEFGWLAAIASLALGLAATWWHLSKPAPSEKCAAVPLTATES